MADVEEILWRLDLRLHPEEGGYFRETYRSPLLVTSAHGERSIATAIYYLLTPDAYSALHRLAGDEVFHFYQGDPVEMLQLHPDGTGAIVTLGPDLGAGMHPQLLVPAGTWQGSRLAPGGSYALLGTTMSPGFDSADYEHGDGEILAERYPAWKDEIVRLARPPR